MKAEELMIGDWVQHQEGACIVTAIAEDGIYFKDSISRGATSFDRIEPIPLTREILKKNGFDVSDREVMYYYFTLEGNPDWQREYFALKQMYDKETKEPKGFSYFVCNVLTIFDYVHQLQHALRLVGLTKLADNFKV